MRRSCSPEAASFARRDSVGLERTSSWLVECPLTVSERSLRSEDAVETLAERFIGLGSPPENGTNESLNSKLRDERLNVC